jgi:hypothetical protein
MGQVLHGSATTTHAIRAEIQRSAASLKELAAQYGLNQKTVAKWRERAFVQDAPMGPRKSCGHRFPQAHAAASGRLPLCLAGDDPASDPLLAPPVPATARHQPLTRGRRRHAQEDRQTRPHRLLPHRHRQGQDRRGQAPFVRGHRPNIQVRLGKAFLLLDSVVMGSQEMKRHIRNTANHPTVMRNCCDLKYCTRQKVKKDAILVLDRAMAGKHCAYMRSMAEWCSNNRGIVDRPSPSRLVRRTPERDLAETDDLEATIRKLTHFIGRLKGLEKCFNHLELLGMQTATSQR